eukprot:gene19572-biopygen2378
MDFFRGRGRGWIFFARRPAVVGNNATQHGGAVHAVHGATVDAPGAAFARNAAIWGGAVYADDAAALRLQAARLRENRAYSGGAVHARRNATVAASDAVFERNDAAHHGGAVHLQQYARLRVDDAALRGNRAGTGGAIWAAGNAIIHASAARLLRNAARRSGGRNHK